MRTPCRADSSGTTGYTWDVENRLASVTLPGAGGTVTYQYDPFGRRIEKVSPSGTTIYAYDGDNVVEELDGGGMAVARYAQGLGIDEPLAMYRGGASYYYNADGLGSITSLTNSSGQIAASYTYDSFGKLTASTGTVINPFRYTGREYGSDTGLYYYRARYYDSNVERFISEDPLQFEASTNFYPYVGSDPGNFTDPFGMAKCKNRPCDEWVKDILNLAAEVSGRFMEYDNPKWNLPLLGRFSHAGHLQQLQQTQDKLADEIDDYNNSGCPTPIPIPVEDLATRPLPPLTPSPIHLPPPPNINPRVVTTVGTGVTGTLLLIMLVLAPAGI